MESNSNCEIFCYDASKVSRIQAGLEQTDIGEVSKWLKAIAAENRLKIVYALCLEEELCVCDIANILEVTVANASQHLQILFKQEMVVYRKEGKLSFYSLANEGIKQVVEIAMAFKKQGELSV